MSTFKKLALTLLAALIVPALGWAILPEPLAKWEPMAWGKTSNSSSQGDTVVDGTKWSLNVDGGSSSIADGVLSVTSGSKSPCVDMNSLYTFGSTNPLTMVTTISLPETAASDSSTVYPIVTFDGYSPTTAFVLYLESITASGATFSVGMGNHTGTNYSYNGYTKIKVDGTETVDTVLIESIKPNTDVTLSIFLSSEGLQLYTVADNSATHHKTWSTAKDATSDTKFCRITFGGYYNQTASYSYAMKSLAFYRNSDATTSLDFSLPTETSVTIDSETASASTFEWSAGDPTAEMDATITASTATTLTLDEAITAHKLTLTGSDITLSGASALTAASTVIDANADTQSATNVSLGSVTINDGKTLTINKNMSEVMTSASGAGTLKFVGGTAEEPLAVLDMSRKSVAIGAGHVVTTAVSDRVHIVTGDNPGVSYYYFNPPADFGLLAGTSIQNVTLVHQIKKFWWERGTFENSILDIRAELHLNTKDAEFHPTIAGLEGSANVTKYWDDNGTHTLTIATSSTNRVTEYSGQITAGNVQVVVSGTGTQTFSGNNTYTLGTTISETATLKLVGSGTLGTGAVAIESGATLLATTAAAADTITLTNTFNGPGTIVKQEAGTLDLSGATFGETSPSFTVEGGTLILPAGANESTITVTSGTLKLGVTQEQAVEGKEFTNVTLPKGENITFVLPGGLEVEGTGTILSAQNYYTYTATEATSSWETYANWSLNGQPLEEGGALPGADANVIIDAPEGGTTLTLSSETETTVKSLTIQGAAVTLAGSALTTETLVLTTALTVNNALTIDADVDFTEDSPFTLTATNLLTIGSTGTLTTKGYVDITGGVYSGAIDVVSGNLALSPTNTEEITGTLTIRADATFTNTRASDAINYRGLMTAVNVYGTLDLGDTRWTTGNTTINVYGGATITGIGDNTGALDYHTDANLNIKSDDTISDKEVTIDAVINTKNGGMLTINVDEGMSASFTRNIKMARPIQKTGAGAATISGVVSGTAQIQVAGGTLTLTGANTYTGGTSIASGATLTITNAGALGTGTIAGAGTLECTGVWPTNKNGLTTGTAATAESDATGWTGTVKLTNVTTNSELVLNNYGHADSTVCFNGVTGGHFTPTDGTTFHMDICLEGNGWKSQNGNGNATLIFTGDLSGSGTLDMSVGTPANGQCYKFTGDVSDFSGSINLGTANQRVSFGCGSQGAGTIGVAKTVNVSGTWTVNNGVKVLATGTLGGTGKIAGTLELQDGATLTLTDAANPMTVTALSVSGNPVIQLPETYDIDYAPMFPVVNLASAATEAATYAGEGITVKVGEETLTTKYYLSVAAESTGLVLNAIDTVAATTPQEVEAVPASVLIDPTLFGYGEHTIFTSTSALDWSTMEIIGLPAGVTEEDIVVTETSWGFKVNTLVIYPIGDSITHGRTMKHVDVSTDTPGGYRLPLYNRLQAAGYKTLYVGDRRHLEATESNANPVNSPTLDEAGQDYHSGHSAWYVDNTSRSVYANVAGWSGTVRSVAGGRDPDVILLLLGVNDLIGDTSGTAAATTATEMKALIWRLAGIGDKPEGETLEAALYPNTRIVLAKVLPSTYDANLNTRIDAYNTALKTFVDELTPETGSDRITLIDLNAPLDEEYGYTYFRYDNLHPAAEGYSQMARNWFAAIESCYPPANAEEIPEVTVKESRFNTSITLAFDKAMDKASVETVDNYTLETGTVTSVKLLDDLRTAVLTVSGATANTTNTLTVDVLTDTLGKASELTELSVTMGPAATRTPSIPAGVWQSAEANYTLATYPLDLVAEWGGFDNTLLAENAAYWPQFGAARDAERPWTLSVLREGANAPVINDDGTISLNGGALYVTTNPEYRPLDSGGAWTVLVETEGEVSANAVIATMHTTGTGDVWKDLYGLRVGANGNTVLTVNAGVDSDNLGNFADSESGEVSIKDTGTNQFVLCFGSASGYQAWVNGAEVTSLSANARYTGCDVLGFTIGGTNYEGSYSGSDLRIKRIAICQGTATTEILNAKYVAEVNGVGYTSFADANAAAGSTHPIELLDSVVIDEDITVATSVTGDYDIEVASNVTLTITNADALGAGTITGAGTIVCSGVLPTNVTGLNTGVAAEGETPASGWTGTVELAGITGVQDLDLRLYGNAASTIKLNSVSGHWGYILDGQPTDSNSWKLLKIPANLCIKGTNTFTNGYDPQSYEMSGLISGDGNIIFSTGTENEGFGIFYFTGNISDFTGNITDGDGKAKITIGATTTADAGTVHIYGAQDINCTLAPKNGITIAGGTTRLVKQQKDYSGTVTVVEGATLNIDTPDFDGSTDQAVANTSSFKERSTIANSGTVILTSGGGYFNITGTGTVQAVGGEAYFYGLGSSGNVLSANLDILEGKEFHIRAWNNCNSISGGNITVNGTVVANGGRNGACSIEVANEKTLSGNGTLGLADGNKVGLTIASGATIDATTGGVTVSTGTVTMPVDGVLHVVIAQTPTTEAPVKILSKTGLTNGRVNLADLSVTIGNADPDTMSYKLLATDEGYVVTPLTADDCVCKIGETMYETLEDALNVSATEGGEIVLMKDITLAETVVVNVGTQLVNNKKQGTVVTVDLAGYTITSSADPAFLVQSGILTFTTSNAEGEGNKVVMTADVPAVEVGVAGTDTTEIPTRCIGLRVAEGVTVTSTENAPSVVVVVGTVGGSGAIQHLYLCENAVIDASEGDFLTITDTLTFPPPKLVGGSMENGLLQVYLPETATFPTQFVLFDKATDEQAATVSISAKLPADLSASFNYKATVMYNPMDASIAGYGVMQYPWQGDSGKVYVTIAEALAAGETDITQYEDTTEYVTVPAGVTVSSLGFTINGNVTVQNGGKYVSYGTINGNLILEAGSEIDIAMNLGFTDETSTFELMVNGDVIFPEGDTIAEGENAGKPNAETVEVTITVGKTNSTAALGEPLVLIHSPNGTPGDIADGVTMKIIFDKNSSEIDNYHVVRTTEYYMLSTHDTGACNYDGIEYETIADALADYTVKSNQTIKLNKAVELDSTIVINVGDGNTVTMDLNGYTLLSSANPIIRIQSGTLNLVTTSTAEGAYAQITSYESVTGIAVGVGDGETEAGVCGLDIATGVTVVPPVVVTKGTIAGGGNIYGSLTLADGVTVDATHGELSAMAVTFPGTDPENKGTITVIPPAGSAYPVQFIKCSAAQESAYVNTDLLIKMGETLSQNFTLDIKDETENETTTVTGYAIATNYAVVRVAADTGISKAYYATFDAAFVDDDGVDEQATDILVLLVDITLTGDKTANIYTNGHNITIAANRTLTGDLVLTQGAAIKTNSNTLTATTIEVLAGATVTVDGTIACADAATPIVNNGVITSTTLTGAVINGTLQLVNGSGTSGVVSTTTGTVVDEGATVTVDGYLSGNLTVPNATINGNGEIMVRANETLAGAGTIHPTVHLYNGTIVDKVGYEANHLVLMDLELFVENEETPVITVKAKTLANVMNTKATEISAANFVLDMAEGSAYEAYDNQESGTNLVIPTVAVNGSDYTVGVVKLNLALVGVPLGAEGGARMASYAYRQGILEVKGVYNDIEAYQLFSNVGTGFTSAGYVMVDYKFGVKEITVLPGTVDGVTTNYIVVTADVDGINDKTEGDLSGNAGYRTGTRVELYKDGAVVEGAELTAENAGDYGLVVESVPAGVKYFIVELPVGPTASSTTLKFSVKATNATQE